MNFVNETPFAANWTTGFDRSGRELLIVVAKATYVLEPDRLDPVLADERVELVEADEFTGEPGSSAPRYETDYAHFKPHCDVLLDGHAHAPAGRPATHVVVGLRVGPMAKSFEVVGPRAWSWGRVSGVAISPPRPFVELPIGYDVAFGGTDATDPDDVATYLPNPVGRGFGKHPRAIDGRLLPSTQVIGQAIRDPSGHYPPMAFGPIGRAWTPRSGWAGTYDRHWLDHQAPFWPEDFDHRYFQAAPPDQWIAHPRGGEDIVLSNLTPEGFRRHRLPRVDLPILLVEHGGSFIEPRPNLDTILIEPEQGRMCLTFRLCHPLRRDPFELREVVVGGRPGEWKAKQRALLTGKTHYRSLGEAVAAARGRARA